MFTSDSLVAVSNEMTIFIWLTKTYKNNNQNYLWGTNTPPFAPLEGSSCAQRAPYRHCTAPRLESWDAMGLWSPKCLVGGVPAVGNGISSSKWALEMENDSLDADCLENEGRVPLPKFLTVNCNIVVNNWLREIGCSTPRNGRFGELWIHRGSDTMSDLQYDDDYPQ